MLLIMIYDLKVDVSMLPFFVNTKGNTNIKIIKGKSPIITMNAVLRWMSEFF